MQNTHDSTTSGVSFAIEMGRKQFLHELTYKEKEGYFELNPSIIIYVLRRYKYRPFIPQPSSPGCGLVGQRHQFPDHGHPVGVMLGAHLSRVSAE